MTQPASEGTSAGVSSVGATVDQLAAAVVALYADAEQRLLASLATVARHGLTDSAAAGQAAMLAQMRRAAERVATQLRLRTGPLAQQVIREAAQRGDAAATDQIRQAVTGHPSLARLYLSRHGHRLASANAIATDLTDRLNATGHRIVRWADDAYRAATAEASTRLVLGREQLTPATAQHLAWSELTRAGVTGYTDTRGRNWDLSSYVEMATRTTVQGAYNASHEARMRSVGIDYFTVSRDGHPCRLCRPWEGSILGPVPGTVRERSAVADREVTFVVSGTLTEAKAAGLFHPNCRHVLLAYLPGVTRAGGQRAWTAADERRYKATQQLRYLERQVRAWKRAQAGALDDLGRQRAGRKVRAYQARIRAHTAQHGLVRRRRREQLDLGNKH